MGEKWGLGNAGECRKAGLGVREHGASEGMLDMGYSAFRKYGDVGGRGCAWVGWDICRGGCVYLNVGEAVVCGEESSCTKCRGRVGLQCGVRKV